MKSLFFKPKPLSEAEKFGIAVGGILTEGNQDPFDRLDMPYGKSDCRELLASGWSATNRSEVIERLECLMKEGHRIPWMNGLEQVKLEASETLNVIRGMANKNIGLGKAKFDFLRYILNDLMALVFEIDDADCFIVFQKRAVYESGTKVGGLFTAVRVIVVFLCFLTFSSDFGGARGSIAVSADRRGAFSTASLLVSCNKGGRNKRGFDAAEAVVDYEGIALMLPHYEERMGDVSVFMTELKQGFNWGPAPCKRNVKIMQKGKCSLFI